MRVPNVPAPRLAPPVLHARSEPRPGRGIQPGSLRREFPPWYRHSATLRAERHADPHGAVLRITPEVLPSQQHALPSVMLQQHRHPLIFGVLLEDGDPLVWTGPWDF